MATTSSSSRPAARPPSRRPAAAHPLSVRPGTDGGAAGRTITPTRDDVPLLRLMTVLQTGEAVLTAVAGGRGAVVHLDAATARALAGAVFRAAIVRGGR
jgi:hypothetical protein